MNIVEFNPNFSSGILVRGQYTPLETTARMTKHETDRVGGEHFGQCQKLIVVNIFNINVFDSGLENERHGNRCPLFLQSYAAILSVGIFTPNDRTSMNDDVSLANINSPSVGVSVIIETNEENLYYNTNNKYNYRFRISLSVERHSSTSRGTIAFF